MSSPNIFSGDTQVNGNLYAQSMTLPAGAVKNSSIEALAGIAASKLQKRSYPSYGQETGSAAVSKRMPIHRVKGTTGTINSFKCLFTTAPVGGATVTIQLKKNGSNILSAATVLDTGNTINVAEDAAGFTSSSLVAGDVLEVDITAAAGGGTLPQGVFCVAEVDEDAV